MCQAVTVKGNNVWACALERGGGGGNRQGCVTVTRPSLPMAVLSSPAITTQFCCAAIRLRGAAVVQGQTRGLCSALTRMPGGP